MKENPNFAENEGNWPFFGPKINIFKLSSVHWGFFELYLTTSIKKWFKVTVLDFEAKFILWPKMEEMVLLGLKINSGSSGRTGVHCHFIPAVIYMF